MSEDRLKDFEFMGRRLTEEEMRQILGMHLHSTSERLLEDSPSLADQFLAKILIKRLQAYSLPFTITDLFFVASLLTFVDRPGLVMILLRLCYQCWKRTGQTRFGIESWSVELFPFGVPTEQDCETYWESQKGSWGVGGIGHDNLLDDPENWR